MALQKSLVGMGLVLPLIAGCVGKAAINPELQVTTHTPSPPDKAQQHRERCGSGDSAACHAAALDAYYSPSNAETDESAFMYFNTACADGYAPSCNGLGVLYAEGRGVEQDDTEAARLYRGACVDGVSTACTHLAEAHRAGKGVPQDDELSERLQTRSRCVFEASLGNGDLASCPPL